MTRTASRAEQRYEAGGGVGGEGLDDSGAGLEPIGGEEDAGLRDALDGAEDARQEGEVAAGLADGGEDGAGVAALLTQLERLKRTGLDLPGLTQEIGRGGGLGGFLRAGERLGEVD